jgi:hypothetical protein
LGAIDLVASRDAGKPHDGHDTRRIDQLEAQPFSCDHGASTKFTRIYT